MPAKSCEPPLRPTNLVRNSPYERVRPIGSADKANSAIDAQFMELVPVGAGKRLGMRHRVGRPARQQDTHSLERDVGLGSGPAQPDAHGAGVIQITPQMKILVAIEAVADRKGIASLARLCEEKLQTDPFFGLHVSVPEPAGEPR